VIWNDLRPQRVSALYMGKHAAAIDLKAMPGQNRWADGNGCLTSNWARNRFSPSMALGRHATACPALFSCFSEHRSGHGSSVHCPGRITMARCLLVMIVLLVAPATGL
jgi:hypothetical protein